MAQQRSISTCKDGSHPPPANADLWVADCVDLAMQSMQSTHLQAAPDRPNAQSKAEQLAPGNGSVLAISKLNDL
jgi:hypothetical protein